jgi:hypothetical protein
VQGKQVIWPKNPSLTKAQKESLRRLEREEEICSKRLEDLTAREWEYERKSMAKVIPEHRQGRKKNEQYVEWEQKIARANVIGLKPPKLRDLAGIKKPAKGDRKGQTEFLSTMIQLRDRFRKAKKRQQPPIPPKR